jgi:hypothetical protein
MSGPGPVEPVVHDADAFEARLRELDYEQTEEARALWAGEKEVSEMAAIMARHADLFSREQLEALQAEESAAETEDGRERLYRLRKTCENGVVSATFAVEQDALANDELAAEVEFEGTSMPVRNAQAELAMLEDYGAREDLGARAEAVSAAFNDRRLELARASDRLIAELTGVDDPVSRADEGKGISLHELARVLAAAVAATTEAYEELRSRWLDLLIGPERAERPSSYHLFYMMRLTPLAGVYTKERATAICLETLRELGFDLLGSNIRTDLEDRPQKSPRPCVFASDPPAVVHLVTRAQGGLQDYQGFLHEAGHALHFAGCDPELPFAFRGISRDNALTEIYSYLCESIIREPGWHVRYFDLASERASENAELTRFLDLFMFRRFAAKLEFELEFWSRFYSDGGTSGGYAERLTEATGFVYSPDRFLIDMDSGFYVADYLRAWIRAAQVRSVLRTRAGGEWWRSPKTGEFLRELFREGLRPSSEDVARRLGFDPLDTEPLLAELCSTAGRPLQ